MSNRREPASPAPAFNEDLFLACVDMVPRLGATSFELRYSEPEHAGSPTVWIAIAEFGRRRHEVAAALDPATAAFRLLEVLVDGGQCTHCKRPTGITEDFTPQLAERFVCWYQYDPELKRFRRGCE